MAPGGREQVRFQTSVPASRRSPADPVTVYSASGRRFHVAGPLTAKLRCPVAVRARGTVESVDCQTLQIADADEKKRLCF